MGSRVKPTRITCVNCNICVNTFRRYPALELDPKVTTIICTWVYPKIVMEVDYVCEPCRDLAFSAVNCNVLSQCTGNIESGLSTKGHKYVCLLCGRSIRNRRSNLILLEEPTDIQQSIINILENRLAPQEITPTDRVCSPCWQRTKREVIRVNQQNEPKPQLDEVNEKQVEQPEPKKKPEQIVLPNYRRAANSSHSCVFPDCQIKIPLHSISDKLRATVIHRHKYYLPKLARVCREHLISNSWDTLYESKNSIQSFTKDHVQHVFSFVNHFSPILD